MGPSNGSSLLRMRNAPGADMYDSTRNRNEASAGLIITGRVAHLKPSVKASLKC